MVNEVFGGHHSEEIARALHGRHWRMYLKKPTENHLDPEYLSSLTAAKLLDAVNNIVMTLQPPAETKFNPKPSAALLQAFVRLRFGLADRMIYSYQEVADTFGVSWDYVYTNLTHHAFDHFKRAQTIKMFYDSLGPLQLTMPESDH